MKLQVSCFAGLLAFVAGQLLIPPCFAQEDSVTSVSVVTKAELAYAQSDGTRNEIFVATYDGETWSDPTQVTYDNDDNVHPALEVDSEGNKYLFWAAFGEEGIRVKYSLYTNGEWGESQTLAPSLSSSLTPSVAFDKNNQLWVVFSGNNGEDNDEIYYIKFSVNAEKQVLKLLNKSNAVPDIEPSIAINDQGNPVVTWKGFRDGSYIQLQSEWKSSSWGEEIKIETNVSKEEDEGTTDEQESTVALPSYVDKDSQASLEIYE